MSESKSKEDKPMNESDYQKLKHDLEYLISVNEGKAKERYKKQLEEIEKSRQRSTRKATLKKDLDFYYTTSPHDRGEGSQKKKG